MEPAAVLRLLLTAEGVKETQLQLARVNAEAKRTADSTGRLEKSFNSANNSTAKFNRNMSGLKNVIGIIKWPTLIAGAGSAAQAVGALGTAAVEVGSALAPLAGALAGQAGLYSALGQGVGVARLALNGVSQALGGNKKALAALTPAQRTFVNQLKSMRGEFKGLQQTAAQGMLPGVTQGLRIVTPLMNRLRPVIGATAKELGGLAIAAAHMLVSMGPAFQRIGQNNVQVIGNLGKAAIAGGQALIRLVDAARPLTLWMSQMIKEGAQWIDSQLKAAQASGQLAHFLNLTKQTMTTMGHIIANLIVGLVNIGKAAFPLGQTLLKQFEALTQKFRDWTQSATGKNQIAAYFQAVQPSIHQALGLIGDLAKNVAQLFKPQPGTAGLIGNLRKLLNVLSGVLITTSRTLGPAAVQLLTNLARILGSVAGTSGPLTLLVKALAKVTGVIANFVSHNAALSTTVSFLGGLGVVAKVLSLLVSPLGRVTAGVGTLIVGFKRLREAGKLLTWTNVIGAGIALTALVVGLAHKLFNLGGQQQRTATSARDVANSWRAAAAAARSMRDVDLSAAQATLDLRQAVMDQHAAQQAANDALHKYGRNSSQYKSAALNLAQANLAVAQANNSAAKASRSQNDASAKLVATTHKALSTETAHIVTLQGAVQELKAEHSGTTAVNNARTALNRAIAKGTADQIKAIEADWNRVRVLQNQYNQLKRAGASAAVLRAAQNALRGATQRATKDQSDFNFMIGQSDLKMKGYNKVVDFVTKFVANHWQGLHLSTKNTNAAMLANFTQTWNLVEQRTHSKSSQTRQEATHDLQVLRENARTIMALMLGNVTHQMDAIKGVINGRMANIVGSAHTSFQHFAHQVWLGMNAGWITAKNGAALILKALNSELSAFGAQTIPQAKLATTGILKAAGFARGGMVDQPMYMVGEEAPRHPEVVVATNPAYRAQNVKYWAQAGKMLGMPGFEKGGIPGFKTGGYAYPFPAGTGLGRTDQGVDTGVPAGGLFRAMGDAIIGSTSIGGWPGGPLMWWRLLSGAAAGRGVYLAERIRPLVHPGQHVSGSTAVAVSTGPSQEMGWWDILHNRTLAQSTGGYSEGQVTAAGSSFRSFIGGGKVGPALAAIAQILAPHVIGGGTIGRGVQAGLRKLADAANQYAMAHAPVFSGTGAIGAIPASTGNVERDIAKALGARGWNKVAIAAAIGNAFQESTLNPGIIRGGNGGLWGFTSGAVSLSSLVAAAHAKGVPWDNAGFQAAFMAAHYGDLRTLNAYRDPRQAALYFMNTFERPKPALANIPNREAAAARAYAQGYAKGGWIPPFAGSFADGGIVPGPLGAPRTAIVHGGERVSNNNGPLVNIEHMEVADKFDEQALAYKLAWLVET